MQAMKREEFEANLVATMENVAKSNTFGRMLRERRKAAGLTLDELALALHVSKSYVWEVESGKRGPFIRERWDLLLAAIPGLTLEELEMCSRAAAFERAAEAFLSALRSAS